MTYVSNIMHKTGVAIVRHPCPAAHYPPPPLLNNVIEHTGDTATLFNWPPLFLHSNDHKNDEELDNYKPTNQQKMTSLLNSPIIRLERGASPIHKNTKKIQTMMMTIGQTSYTNSCMSKIQLMKIMRTVTPEDTHIPGTVTIMLKYKLSQIQ
jgi:hypothetical protein